MAPAGSRGLLITELFYIFKYMKKYCNYCLTNISWKRKSPNQECPAAPLNQRQAGITKKAVWGSGESSEFNPRRPGFKSKLYHETAAASSGETACPTRLRQDHTWQHFVHTALCWNKYLLYTGVVTVVTGQQLWVDPVILRSGWFCLPWDTGQCLETFMVVTTWGRGHYWPLVGRAQGC